MLESEKKSANKCTSIKGNIRVNHLKFQTTLTHIKGLQSKADGVVNDIKNTWDRTDALVKEQRDLSDKLQNLKVVIKQLDQTIEEEKHKQQRDSQLQLKNLEDIQKNKNNEKYTLEEKLAALRDENMSLVTKNNELGKQKIEIMDHISKTKAKKAEIELMTEEFKQKKEAINAEIDSKRLKLKERSEHEQQIKQEIDDTKEQMQTTKKSIYEKISEKEDLKKRIQKRENKIKASRKEKDKKEKDLQFLEDQNDDQQKDIIKNKKQLIALEKNKRSVKRELKSTTGTLLELQNKMDSLNKTKEYYESQLVIEKEALSQMQKQVDKAKETYDYEIKTRATMEMEIKNKKNKLFSINEEFIMLESKAKKLHNKVNGFEIETEKLNHQIKILQDQQQKYGIEASSAHARYYQTVEELKIKNNIIAELQKKNLELESKLKHQMNLYEAVRSDRNLYSKNLLEAQEEIGDLTKKYTRMAHQINQLKEEIKTKSR